MRGGRLEIFGDAGDHLGAPLAGELAGMNGGVLIVRGRAGAFARRPHAARPDRGAEGRGDYAGCRMIAGTLVVAGGAGAMPGYLMRRGSILLDRAPKSLSPSFVECGAPDSVFASLRRPPPYRRRDSREGRCLARRRAGLAATTPFSAWARSFFHDDGACQFVAADLWKGAAARFDNGAGRWDHDGALRPASMMLQAGLNSLIAHGASQEARTCRVADRPSQAYRCSPRLIAGRAGTSSALRPQVERISCQIPT